MITKNEMIQRHQVGVKSIAFFFLTFYYTYIYCSVLLDLIIYDFF